MWHKPENFAEGLDIRCVNLEKNVRRNNARYRTSDIAHDNARGCTVYCIRVCQNHGFTCNRKSQLDKDLKALNR